jgi:F420-non-reducing hydrogenase iron-sulfur subunit
MKLPGNTSSDQSTRITVFYCVNALPQGLPEAGVGAKIKAIKLACSAMVKDVFLLRAFEAGADGVVVLGCPHSECQRIDGNSRAEKRVERTRAILMETGIGGDRLIYGMVAEAVPTLRFMEQTLTRIGKSPLKKITAK